MWLQSKASEISLNVSFLIFLERETIQKDELLTRLTSLHSHSASECIFLEKPPVMTRLLTLYLFKSVN